MKKHLLLSLCTLFSCLEFFAPNVGRVIAAFAAPQDSILQLIAREVTEQQSWDLSALEQGRYVWDVKSVDAAGNGSGLSTQSVIFIR